MACPVARLLLAVAILCESISGTRVRLSNIGGPETTIRISWQQGAKFVCAKKVEKSIPGRLMRSSTKFCLVNLNDVLEAQAETQTGQQDGKNTPLISLSSALTDCEASDYSLKVCPLKGTEDAMRVSYKTGKIDLPKSCFAESSQPVETVGDGQQYSFLIAAMTKAQCEVEKSKSEVDRARWKRLPEGAPAGELEQMETPRPRRGWVPWEIDARFMCVVKWQKGKGARGRFAKSIMGDQCLANWEDVEKAQALIKIAQRSGQEGTAMHVSPDVWRCQDAEKPWAMNVCPLKGKKDFRVSLSGGKNVPKACFYQNPEVIQVGKKELLVLRVALNQETCDIVTRTAGPQGPSLTSPENPPEASDSLASIDGATGSAPIRLHSSDDSIGSNLLMEEHGGLRGSFVSSEDGGTSDDRQHSVISPKAASQRAGMSPEPLSISPKPASPRVVSQSNVHTEVRTPVQTIHATRNAIEMDEEVLQTSVQTPLATRIALEMEEEVFDDYDEELVVDSEDDEEEIDIDEILDSAEIAEDSEVQVETAPPAVLEVANAEPVVENSGSIEEEDLINIDDLPFAKKLAIWKARAAKNS